MFIVAVKCDLKNKREVSFEEAMVFAKQNELFYIETSSKFKINIQKAFYLIPIHLLMSLIMLSKIVKRESRGTLYGAFSCFGDFGIVIINLVGG